MVRCFSVAFEGFLIKFFLEIGKIDKDKYIQNPRSVYIDALIRELRTYPQIERKYKGLVSDALRLWRECRHSYLHSDMYSYSELIDIEKAEAKVIEIFGAMEKLVDCKKLIQGESEISSS